MRNLLLASCFVLLAAGCADLAGSMESTHTLMTQTPAPDTDRADREHARRQAEWARIEREAQAGQTVPVVIQEERPLSRSERAINVLRRSPITRWMFPSRALGPAAPAPATAPNRGSASTVNTSASPTAEVIPSVPPSTPEAGPTPQAGEGRVIIGKPRDTGSGIKSTVTGNPVEPIPTTPGDTDAEA